MHHTAFTMTLLFSFIPHIYPSLTHKRLELIGGKMGSLWTDGAAANIGTTEAAISDLPGYESDEKRA
jgi:hypothetical protein